MASSDSQAGPSEATHTRTEERHDAHSVHPPSNANDVARGKRQTAALPHLEQSGKENRQIP